MTLPIRNARMKLSQGQIFSRESGNGVAIAFLHGSWDDGSQWLPVIEQLSAHYHCVAPDLLGFGDSERPDCHYSIEMEVECLAEYLELLRVRQLYLVGHSLGAWVAASYALKYPEQVQGLVLLSPEGVEIESRKQRSLELQILLGSRFPLILLRVLRPFARLIKQHRRIDQFFRWRYQLEQSQPARQILFQRRSAEIKAELLQDRLGWLKLPVLLLQAEQDAQGLARATVYHHALPLAELHIIPQADINCLHTHPQDVTQAIQQFLLEHS